MVTFFRFLEIFPREELTPLKNDRPHEKFAP